MTKITLVGAGSVVFAKNLICDILQYPALSDSTICLMDIDARRLEVIGKLARRIVAQLGVKARIETTLDLRKACKGAKFVITTIQVGGYKPSTVVDFEIPARYGVKQTIADTLGVGGVFRALRSIPELTKVARMLQEVGAPDPVLLNYTNPMAMNMWAIDRLTGIASVGLCHSVQGTSRQISSYCGFDYKDVSYLVAGINHMAFFLKFEYKGRDAYPLLFRAMEKPGIFACDKVRFEMMRRLGYFVTESSEHQSEYVPYFIHHGDEVIEKFNVPVNEYIRRCESMVSTWSRTERDLLDESRPVQIHQSVEYGSTIINSIVTDEPSVIYGNVPNRQLITNLTQGCSVEVPCLVNRQGIQPTHIGGLPPQLAAIIHTNLNVQELAVEAAVTGRREYIYQSVMMDPHTATVLTLDKIWAMCDDLIEAHQKDGFLGEFKPVAKNTGRALGDLSRVFLSVRPKGVPFLGGASSGEFVLVAENGTAAPFKGDVQIVVAGAQARCLPASRLNLNVASGKTASIPFRLEIKGGIEDNLVISLKTSSLETLGSDFLLPKRERLDVPVDASGKKRMPFEVRWSGNTVADGSAWLTAGEFAVEMRVEDTDLKIHESDYWESSFVGVALKDALSPDALTRIFVVLPDSKKPRAIVDGKTWAGCKVGVRADKGGYSLSLRINLKAAGLTASRPFLWEMMFHVNALGTAHGRIRHTWHGTSDLRTDQSRFALAVPRKN